MDHHIKRRKGKIDRCSIPTSIGNFTYYLKRSYKRSTIEITISDSAEVFVKAPTRIPDSEIRNFIIEKEKWIQKGLHKKQLIKQKLQKQKYKNGHKFLFLGK